MRIKLKLTDRQGQMGSGPHPLKNAFLKEPVRHSLYLHDIFGSHRADKLALLVVELHVGRGDSVMRSGIKATV